MTETIMILSTIAGLVVGPGAPASDATATATAQAAAIDDPCEGQGVVYNIPSPHDPYLHTCTCTPVTGLHGEVTRMSVSCR